MFLNGYFQNVATSQLFRNIFKILVYRYNASASPTLIYLNKINNPWRVKKRSFKPIFRKYKGGLKTQIDGQVGLFFI